MDGLSENHLGRDWELSQEELLDVIVQLASSLLAGEEKHHHLNTVVKLLLEFADPSINAHTWSNLHHVRFARVFVAARIEALLHSGLELIGNLSVAITVEDTPGLQGSLCEHLALDLSIDIASVLLDVEAVGSPSGVGSHEKVTGRVLETL